MVSRCLRKVNAHSTFADVRLIVFTFAIVTTLMAAAPTAFSFINPTSAEWLRLLATGVFATWAQELMTMGYVGLPASLASPILLLMVPFSTLIGWLAWGELPDGLSFLGMALICAGLLAAFRMNRPAKIAASSA